LRPTYALCRATYQLYFVVRFDPKRQAAPVDGHELRGDANAHAGRRRRHVFERDLGSDGLLPARKIRIDHPPRALLTEAHEDGRREHVD
jgi:hypothetical protein